jgi:hypothetical protein
MTFFPIEKPCDKCGREFLAAISGQTTCTTCLIMPSRKNIIGPEQTIKPKGDDMPLDLKEKPCVDCLKQFKPTSNVQKRCLPCKEIYDASKKKNKKSARLSEPALVKKKSPSLSPDCDDALVLRMLITVGLVTDEKVQAARDYAKNDKIKLWPIDALKLLARMKVQEEILDRNNQHIPTVKELSKEIAGRIMKLSSATWSMEDCVGCQKRTAAAPDLFAEINVKKDDRCLDAKCWGKHTEAALATKIAEFTPWAW